MKFNRFNQCVFCRQAFRCIINQSVNVMPRAMLVGSKITVDTKFGYRPITEIVRMFTEIFENREMLLKCLKTPQNRETL